MASPKSFWNEFPDETLSPLDLAEKKWCLKSEDLQKLEKYCIAHTHYGFYNHMGEIVECEEKSYLVEMRAKVKELWLEWVNLKPYVSDEMKKKLGCPGKKEEPKLNLEKFKNLPELQPFEDLFKLVQQEIDSCQCKGTQMTVFTFKFNVTDVQKMVAILKNERFNICLRGDRIEFKYIL